MRAYILNESGELEMTNHYDPYDAEFLSEDEADEIAAQCEDEYRVVLDLHGRVYAIQIDANTQPIPLADYSDQIADNLKFPRG